MREKCSALRFSGKAIALLAAGGVTVSGPEASGDCRRGGHATRLSPAEESAWMIAALRDIRGGQGFNTTRARATLRAAMESPHKGKTGLRRLINATRYSLDGFAAAIRHEDAFRQELVLFVLSAPLGLWLGANGVERALLVGSLFLVLIVELLNSAIEAAVDRISLDHHPLAKRAKDIGSAAVMLSLAAAAATWLLVLLGR